MTGRSVESARATLLSCAGIERASQGIRRNLFGSPTGSDPALDWTYREGFVAPGTPLKDAANPSFHDRGGEPWFDDGDGVFEPGAEGWREVNGLPGYQGRSGRLRGAFHPHGDTYTLQVEDANARIMIDDTVAGAVGGEDRDGDGVLDPGEDRNANGLLDGRLAVLLNNLAEALRGSGRGPDLVGTGPSSMGTLLVSNRPPGGWGSVGAIEPYLVSPPFGNPALARRRYLQVRDDVTTDAWVDPSVIQPKPLALRTRSFNPPIENRPTYGSRVYARCDELHPKSLALEPRAPVNLNLCAPEVMRAVLDLEGFFVNARSGAAGGGTSVHYHDVRDVRRPDFSSNRCGYWYGWWVPYRDADLTNNFFNSSYHQGFIETAAIPFATNGPIVDRILAARPFPTWDAFRRWVLDLDGGGLPVDEDFIAQNGLLDPQMATGNVAQNEWVQGTGYIEDLDGDGRLDTNGQDVNGDGAPDVGLLTPYQKDLLLAAANPNTRLNDINPDDLLYGHIDKSDLVRHTTDGSLRPGGRFHVQSIGQTRGTDGTLLFERRIEAVHHAARPVRESSQRDFLRGVLAGEPLDAHLPWITGAVDSKGGYALAVHPEVPLPEIIAQTVWDGQISLGSVRDSPDTESFRATFASGLDAEVGGAVAAMPDVEGPYPFGASNRSLMAANDADATFHPTNLRRDGVYTEKNSSLMYAAPGNIRSEAGAISLWVKPNWEPELAQRVHQFFSLAYVYDESIGYNPSPFGIWYLPANNQPEDGVTGAALSGMADYTWWPRAVVFGFGGQPVLNRARPATAMGRFSPTLNHAGHPRPHPPAGVNPFGTRDVIAGHRWIHVAAAWDMNAANPDLRLALWINGVAMTDPETIAGDRSYESLGPNDFDYTHHHGGVANTIRFGESSHVVGPYPTGYKWRNGYTADATFGGIKVYVPANLSADLAAIVATFGPSMQSHWTEGRFVREPVPPAYTSGRFTPSQYGDAGTLVAVDWTDYRPADPDGGGAQPAVTLEVVNDGGGVLRGAYGDPFSAGPGGGAYDGLALQVPPNGIVRYRARLHSGLQTPPQPNVPLLESPILDDVTLYFSWSSGPRLVRWEDVDG